MSEKKAYEPIAVALEKDKRYAWCTCSHSSNQPFCDGSHKAQNATPSLGFAVEEEKTAYLCTCKQTKNPPFCDGSHKN
ncbi:CDGSH iron-sulfur domain-containing protein [Flavobacteriaceae bacterium KMM 6897]|nr:CDGSH iron-sulfur domain-containing protein [Flavobacteriaceae bacterium KMM 6897]MEB8345270.1 CDGSH iron-sulfur domain-containing protein [Flavobacteriaceae bacterium KMM 6898]